ncbi:hypothetical protein Syun_006451 [Stephania yunnanensis]|uniref:Uncharacterized protein n=1 Tax=Stephania yunnanensis TaxID=152371 RepID=A0AAP0KZ91_9MAGN
MYSYYLTMFFFSLCQVEFLDRYKVGELTGLLTSDLGSIKDIVSENVSRDRGFRALSEASFSTLSRSIRYNLHTFCPVPPTCSSFGAVYGFRFWLSRYDFFPLSLF